jgi:hypothetical protein
MQISTSQELSAASARIRGAAVGVLITVTFGALWAWWGDLALGGLAALLLVVITGAITIPLILAAIRLLLVTQRLQPGVSGNPFRALSYRLAVTFEAITIPVADALLGKEHHAAFMAPVTAMIVGVHFFGLVSASKVRLYLGVGLAMCALAGLTMLLLPISETVGSGAAPHHIIIWTVVVGLGCAAILWASAIDRLMFAYEEARQVIRRAPRGRI